MLKHQNDSAAPRNKKALHLALIILACLVVGAVTSPSSPSSSSSSSLSSGSPCVSRLSSHSSQRHYHSDAFRFSEPTTGIPASLGAVIAEHEVPPGADEDVPENYFPRRVLNTTSSSHALTSSSSSSFFKTRDGTALWQFELPSTRADQVRRVRLNKPWKERRPEAKLFPDSKTSSKKQDNNNNNNNEKKTSKKSAEVKDDYDQEEEDDAILRAAATTSHDVLVSSFPLLHIEAIDPRVRLRMRGIRRCNKKLTMEEKKQCFLDLNRRYDRQLFFLIVPNLRFLLTTQQQQPQQQMLQLPPTSGQIERSRMRRKLRQLQFVAASPRQSNTNSKNNNKNDATALAASGIPSSSSSINKWKEDAHSKPKRGQHRRFYYDLGSRSYESRSVSWFKGSYPGSSLFHVVCFEMDAAKYENTFPREQLRSFFESWELVHAAVWVDDKGVAYFPEEEGSQMAHISFFLNNVISADDGSTAGAGAGASALADSSATNQTQQRQQEHNDDKEQAADGEEEEKNKEKPLETSNESVSADQSTITSSSITTSPPPLPTRVAPSIDFAAYLLERHAYEDVRDAAVMTKPRTSDFIIAKFDIEGAEWPVLQRMIETGAIYLLDEVFLECHVTGEHRRMMHECCVDLINLLRRMGIFAHRWV